MVMIVVLGWISLVAGKYLGSAALSAGSFLDRADDAASLSNLLSSPERYANALNMSVQQVVELKNAHIEASNALHQELATNKMLSGAEKQTLQCQHRYQHGRHPFVCPDCWSYLPVCLCRKMKIKFRLAENLQVIVWTHHKEWGLTSNTGCILAKSLSPCQMLMKGLPEHDQQLDSLLKDERILPVVLWPSGKKNQSAAAPEEEFVITLSQIQREVRDNMDRKILFIAVEGTWRNARRMVGRLPRHVVTRLDLPESVVFPLNAPAVSILSSLRRKGPCNISESRRRVCTAEAVVKALVAVGGLSEEDGDCILETVKTKVDLIRRYRGKVVEI